MSDNDGAEGAEGYGGGYSRTFQRVVGSLEKMSRKYEAAVGVEHHARICVIYSDRNGKITAMGNQEFVQIVTSSTVPALLSKYAKAVPMVAPPNLQPAHGRAEVQQPSLTVAQVSKVFLRTMQREE